MLLRGVPTFGEAGPPTGEAGGGNFLKASEREILFGSADGREADLSRTVRGAIPLFNSA